MSEREQQRNVLYTLETGLHQLQLQENTLNNEIRERGVLEEQLEVAKKEITTLLVKSKVLLILARRTNLGCMTSPNGRNWISKLLRHKLRSIC
jgi:hypothetical protein